MNVKTRGIEDKIKNKLIELIIIEATNNSMGDEIIHQIKQLSIDDDISELGLFNSMTFLKLVTLIEDEYDFEFDNNALKYTLFKTLKDLTDYIIEKISSQ